MSRRSRLITWSAAALAIVALTSAACTTDEAAPKATATVASSPTATSTSTAPAASTGATGATGVSGATGTASGGITPPSPTGTKYVYACAEGKTFEMLAYPAAQERATLTISAKTIELKQERSASGVRYSDGTITLIGKGLEATIEERGVTTYKDCKGRQP